MSLYEILYRNVMAAKLIDPQRCRNLLVVMHAEFSILELVETADGVAIAAPVREIADSSCHSYL